MFKPFIINKPVFFGALLVIGMFVAVGVLLPNQARDIFGAIQNNILQAFGWFYFLAVGIFLVVWLKPASANLPPDSHRAERPAAPA
jgi:choline/glycine/proline betaine transport protein